MQILKFGGSSVANPEIINSVVAISKSAVEKDPHTIIILSALGGITDALLDAGVAASKGDVAYKEKLQHIEQRHISLVKSIIPLDQQSSLLSIVKKRCNEIEDTCNGVFLLKELSARTKDAIISYGELLSSQIFAGKLKSLGIHCIWKDARELIITNSDFGNAGLDYAATNKNISYYFKNNESGLYIIPGFIGKDKMGITTTLGRGGSDYTAAIIGAALDASVVEIWTDVSGMMTADPRLVSNAKIIGQISYQEAMELSHFGAKVIFPATLQPLLSKGIPVLIKNTFSPADPGTLIHHGAHQNDSIIRGISSINNIALISLEGSGMIGIPGFSKRLFEALSEKKINVILITQSSSEHSICVGIEQTNTHIAKEVIDATFANEIDTRKVEPLKVEKDLAIIALVGDNMKNHTGISGRMFGALGRNGVNVRAIAQGSSERNISAVVALADVKKAVNVLHEEFFETSYKQINLFICGTGNVGSRLLAQLQKQQYHLQDHLRLQVRVTGISNSRKMTFDEQGIHLESWSEVLEKGEKANMKIFTQTILSRNLRNSVYVDITANADIANTYPDFLEKSVSVVACNKIACSSSYDYYKLLKDLSREFNAMFLFETNVGAGLPVIGTLNDLLRSGDKVRSIEAVLSGTLNFVFNNYSGQKSFASIVRQAQDEGYTEPDPRLDLSGLDVMRKIMILARESGAKLEMEDITNHSFMPESCMKGDVKNFYSEMEKEEAHFMKLITEAEKRRRKLKFVAKYQNGKASVGLEQIEPDHDFYHLYGKDNAVLFYTDRYPEQPLVVKGAGAGAEVTASGVFADIIRVAAPSK
jgi:bifunctional aspartokinase / homoserine dehydrogenase 1